MTLDKFKSLRPGDIVAHTATVSGEVSVGIVTRIWADDYLVEVQDTLEGSKIQVEYNHLHDFRK